MVRRQILASSRRRHRAVTTIATGTNFTKLRKSAETRTSSQPKPAQNDSLMNTSGRRNVKSLRSDDTHSQAYWKCERLNAFSSIFGTRRLETDRSAQTTTPPINNGFALCAQAGRWVSQREAVFERSTRSPSTTSVASRPKTGMRTHSRPWVYSERRAKGFRMLAKSRKNQRPEAPTANGTKTLDTKAT